MLKVGTIVTMNENALENYGEKWREVKLIVTHAANKYMPSGKFYAKGMPNGFHPGYDEGVSPQGLYDLQNKDTGEALGMSLYRWELEVVK